MSAGECTLFVLILITLSDIVGDVSLLSSLAVIIGAVFVAVQLTQNNRLLRAAADQAKAALMQTQLQNEQLKQNHDLANMDLVMRLYEFANSAEFQSAWLTVLNTKVTSFEQFEKLPEQTKVSFYQVAALFESLGVLVEKKIMSLETVDDMFLTEVAWKSMRSFVDGMRQKYGAEFTYVFFEKLYKRLTADNKPEG
jgi:hypothetical protein